MVKIKYAIIGIITGTVVISQTPPNPQLIAVLAVLVVDNGTNITNIISYFRERQQHRHAVADNSIHHGSGEGPP